MATCYRHPDRETGVSCSNCDRPICPDCMTPTSVGMRCPECARQKTKVHTIRSMQSEPRVTYALIAINAIAFLGSGRFGVGSGGGSRLFNDFALFGPSIDVNHEYWRLVTGGFLHSGLLHIAFNMYLLYVLGQMLEPALGSVRFGALYLASLLAGSAGALVVTPDAVTVGASGAVFGLMGVAFAEMRSRGMDPFAGGIMSSIGGLIVINLVFSFLWSGISIGGHIGGLVGGVAAAWLMDQADRRRLPRAAALAAPALVAVVSVVVGIAAAGSSGIG
jgi:membrane associated rhomboid family serine protease